MAAMNKDEINVDLFNEVQRLKNDLTVATGKLSRIENEWRYGTDNGLDAVLEDSFSS